jgi:hypothetical protein
MALHVSTGATLPWRAVADLVFQAVLAGLDLVSSTLGNWKGPGPADPDPTEPTDPDSRWTTRPASGHEPSDAESGAHNRNRLFVGEDGSETRAAASKASQRWPMPEGLLDRSSRPGTFPTQILAEWQKLVVELRQLRMTGAVIARPG